MKASISKAHRGDQFVSVASITRELLPKLEAIMATLQANHTLMLTYHALVHEGEPLPGYMGLNRAISTLGSTIGHLRIIREVDPQ